jgi:hypothetical protein
MWKRHKLRYYSNDRFRREVFLAVCCQIGRDSIWFRPSVERERLDEKYSPLLIADYEGLEPEFRQQITNSLCEFRT